MIKRMILDYYFRFVGLPYESPIVRNNIESDALTLVVLEILYKDLIGYSIEPSNIKEIGKNIVAPPDDGIDLFIERVDGDEHKYDIIQVKNSELTPSEIQSIFALMQKKIKMYLNNPSDIDTRLRTVLSETNFDSVYKNNCTYYVVHKGTVDNYKGLMENEKIITFNELERLSRCNGEACVPSEHIKLDSSNNITRYQQEDAAIKESAFIYNLNGYDLGTLCNKYDNTEFGRNILFGKNLRESLSGKSKTYLGMKQTILEEPERFWFYNNGITIIAKAAELNTATVEATLSLSNFSIINGAQTTSALGKFLKDAQVNKDEFALEQLKKVYVLARIIVVEDDEFSSSIAIYNNTQNPITNRDIVSNRLEQKHLHDWLLNGPGEPIYVEIRRGSRPPDKLSSRYKHRKITNETLAQLCYAGFERMPYVAKDKKASLFKHDYTKDDCVINKNYHHIFNYGESIDKKQWGVVFRRTKEEIDELLFVDYLYREAKKYCKKKHNEKIDTFQKQLDQVEDDGMKERLIENIRQRKVTLNISNICLFYNIALYFELKEQFEFIERGKVFDYERFYSDKEYMNQVIEMFANKILSKTTSIMKEKSQGTSELNNWIRSKKNQDLFLSTLRGKILESEEYEKDFEEFIKLSKVESSRNQL